MGLYCTSDLEQVDKTCELKVILNGFENDNNGKRYDKIIVVTMATA